MRLERLEHSVSDWTAVCRIRADGLNALSAKAKELMKGSRELWRLKQELGKVVWIDLEPALKEAIDDPARLETIAAEFMQSFSQESDIQGIFGVGASVEEARALDSKFRPSLAALRAHALVKHHVGPALKKANSPVQFWIPLSSGESKRKRRRQEKSDPSAPHALPEAKNAPPREKSQSHRQRRGDGRRSS